MTKHERIFRGLRPGEKMIWTGTPCEYKDYGRIDRVLLPVSMVVLMLSTFFAMFVIFSIVRTGMHAWQLISLLALVLVGGLTIYAVFFRFIVKRGNKADFAYGITSEGRVLICDHSEKRTYAFERQELAQAAVTEQDKHGTGTIYLVPKRLGHLLDNTGLEFLGLSSGSHVAMFDVENCEKICKAIRPPKAQS